MDTAFLVVARWQLTCRGAFPSSLSPGQSSSLAGAPLANKLVNKRPHGENYRCWRHLRQLITISQILAMAPSFNNLTEDDGNDSEEEIDVSGS